MEHNRIATGTCDCCNAKGPGVLQHDYNEVPVLFECRRCAPDAFERVARRDVDGWLAGGHATALGM